MKIDDVPNDIREEIVDEYLSRAYDTFTDMEDLVHEYFTKSEKSQSLSLGCEFKYLDEHGDAYFAFHYHNDATEFESIGTSYEDVMNGGERLIARLEVAINEQRLKDLEINLKQKQKAHAEQLDRERKEFERLKKKFEGE